MALDRDAKVRVFLHCLDRFVEKARRFGAQRVTVEVEVHVFERHLLLRRRRNHLHGDRIRGRHALAVVDRHGQRHRADLAGRRPRRLPIVRVGERAGRGRPPIAQRVAVRILRVGRRRQLPIDFDGAGLAARLDRRCAVRRQRRRGGRGRRDRSRGRRKYADARVVAQAHLQAQAIEIAVFRRRKVATMEVVRRGIRDAGTEVEAAVGVELEAAKQIARRIRIPLARHAGSRIGAAERLRLIEQRFALHFADDPELRPARERAGNAPDEAGCEVVALGLAAHLDAGGRAHFHFLSELTRANQIKLEVELSRAESVVVARRGQLGHHAHPGCITVRRRLRGDVELRADPRVADAGAPALVDQVVLRLAVLRHRHQVRVNAAHSERAENFDAIGGAEREHAANVGDVAESFAAVEIHELCAAAPPALGQGFARRDKPDSGVAENCVAAGPALLCQRRNCTQEAQR